LPCLLAMARAVCSSRLLGSGTGAQGGGEASARCGVDSEALGVALVDRLPRAGRPTSRGSSRTSPAALSPKRRRTSRAVADRNPVAVPTQPGSNDGFSAPPCGTASGLRLANRFAARRSTGAARGAQPIAIRSWRKSKLRMGANQNRPASPRHAREKMERKSRTNWRLETRKPRSSRAFLSAPERIRTSDLRFRSGPSGARVRLVSGGSVARGAVQGGRIWRVWDEVRDEVASAGDAACRCPRTHTMTARHHSRFSRKGAARSRPRARCSSSVVATVAGRHADASAHAFKQKRGRVATSARPLADSPIKKAPCL
jgi:hypothetical protein